MTSTRIEVDDDQFAVLETIRTYHGVNWRGMLIQGAERLEAGVVFPSRYESGCSQPDREEGEREGKGKGEMEGEED